MQDTPSKFLSSCKAAIEPHMHYQLTHHEVRNSDEVVHIYLGLYEGPNGLPGFCTTTIYLRRKDVVKGFATHTEHVEVE